jgi:hypothetical protein
MQSIAEGKSMLSWITGQTQEGSALPKLLREPSDPK